MFPTSAILILSLNWLGGAAQAPAPPNVATRETTTVATVDRVERSSRVLTAHSEGNVVHTLYVDPAVKGFDDLKKGDVVTVRYTESVVVQVRPNAKLTALQDTTAEAQKAGDMNVLQQQKRIVTIEDIDSQGLFVTYRTQDNTRGVHAVQNKELLKGIRRGDRVEVTLTQARAISIERKR
jgi:hypothetical protein